VVDNQIHEIQFGSVIGLHRKRIHQEPPLLPLAKGSGKIIEIRMKKVLA